MNIRICDECGKRLEGIDGYHDLPTGYVHLNGKLYGQSCDLCDDHYDKKTHMVTNCSVVSRHFPAALPTKKLQPFDVVVNIIKDIAGAALSKKYQFTENTKFSEDLFFDDLDMVELLIGLEEDFDIYLTDEDLNSFKQIKDIIDFLNKKGAKFKKAQDEK